MVAQAWILWLDRLHRWIGLILFVPITVIAATGVLLVHDSLLAGKQGPKSPPAVAGAGLRSDMAAVAKQLGPQVEAWFGHMPAFVAAIEHFREKYGQLPLREVHLRHDPLAGWVIRIRSQAQASMPEREIVWLVEEGRPLDHSPRGAADAYRTPAGNRDWKKLVKDLHTGKFLGKIPGQIWADAAGVGTVFLAVSGLVMYAGLWLRKRHQRRKSSVASSGVGERAPPGGDGATAATKASAVTAEKMPDSGTP